MAIFRLLFVSLQPKPFNMMKKLLELVKIWTIHYRYMSNELSCEYSLI